MTADARSNSDRFLTAFARIEDALEELTGGRRHRESFSSMIHQAGRKNAAVKMFENDLREFTELRNAIVHDRGHGYVIAEPHDEIVEEIERIAAIVLDPPRLRDVVDGPVACLRPDDTVADAARAIRRHGFAQFPIYDDDGLVGLLTYRALARWLAERFDAGGAVDGDAPLRDVIAHAGSAHTLVGQDVPILDVINLFADHARHGESLTAVLVTRTGADTEPAIGIITAADLPKLFDLVGLNHG